MSTVLTRRRTSRGRDHDRESYRQPSLFAQVVTPLPLEREARPEAAVFDVPITDPPEAGDTVAADAASTLVGPAPTVAEPMLAGRTLDEAISELWSGLLAGEPGACPVCDGELEPRHSAGAGVVGGRCGSCATTLA
jgi:hypothetical protein